MERTTIMLADDVDARLTLDLPLGMVDASVVALAERRELEVIATLDERHFRVVRPRHTRAFTPVP
jgi:predicted nucleic acid-binding protein